MSLQSGVVGDYNKLTQIFESSLARPLWGILHQLPPDIADFTGRQEELESVTAQVQQATQAGKTEIAIAVVTGMAGVGKSALAIHVAHQLKNDFPDAQLYVNLRGTESQPLEPLEVLASFLRAWGGSDAGKYGYSLYATKRQGESDSSMAGSLKKIALRLAEVKTGGRVATVN